MSTPFPLPSLTHLRIKSLRCWEGKAATVELLKFYSRFCKFLCPALWPRRRLSASHVPREEGWGQGSRDLVDAPRLWGDR